MVQMSPECKTVIFSNLILAKFYWNLELADLWHFPPRSPPLREPLPVFIRQKNCEHCPSYLTLPLAHLPWASSSQYLSSKKLQNFRVGRVISFFPFAHLPCASPSQFRCLLLNMRSADLEISTLSKIHQLVTKLGKIQWGQNQATLQKFQFCLVFHSTYLPTRFRSWPRSLWSLKWNTLNEKCNRDLLVIEDLFDTSLQTLYYLKLSS